jgi:hypothetical protein
MSFPNYEGFPAQPQEDGNGQAAPGAPGPQAQIQPIETTGGQFPPNQGPIQGIEQSGTPGKTTLW